MPELPLTTPGVLEAAAEAWPDAVAVEDEGVRWTFVELLRLARCAAAGLRAMGVGRGDRVALWAPNVPGWIPVALGVHLAGAAIVPISTRYKGGEARDVVDRSAAKVVVLVDGFLGLDLRGMLGTTRAAVVTPDELLAHPDDGAVVSVGPDDTSDILFTSGTTGRSKGVVTTHAQTVRTFRTWVEVVGLRAGDRYLVVNPFFHAFGYKAGWLASLIAGATVLPMARFDAAAVLTRITRDRVTVLPGPPSLYQSLLTADRRGADLRSLRLAVTGAASIPVSLIRRMSDELGFQTVLTAYGLTESTGVATMCRPGDDAELIATTSGRAIPGCEVRTVGPDGTPVAVGEPGEVQVRGYNVMQGYLDDPDATAAAVVDGWLHTGDLGVLDANGNLKITDRLKDLFIVGGFNAYPAEIESMLTEHPQVAEVAVVGVPDDRLGEVGRAFVVPLDGFEEHAFLAWAKERMANFKVPRSVTLLDALPRNAAGKVLKTTLRER